MSDTAPATLTELAAIHLTAAQQILASAESLAATLQHQPQTPAQMVATANVHARIAHASAALAMLEPRPVTRTEAPGLASLMQLADAVERLAAATERSS